MCVYHFKLKLSHAATSLLIKDNNINNANHFFTLDYLQNSQNIT